MGFLFAVFQAVTILPICTMVYLAVGLAMRQKQTALLSWLVPLALVNTVAALLSFYSFGFRLLHLRANVVSAVIAYGFGMINFAAAMYAAWRILAFVRGYAFTSVSQQNVSQQEEGVWPPPPTRKP